MLLDPFMASLKSKTSSIDPYIKGEVWSLLSALEIPYTPQKKYTYQNHIWATTFVTKIIYFGLPFSGYNTESSQFY